MHPITTTKSAGERAAAEKYIAERQAARDDEERNWRAHQDALLADRPEGLRVLWVGCPDGFHVIRAVLPPERGVRVERGVINARGRAVWTPVRDPSLVAAILKFAVIELAGGNSWKAGDDGFLDAGRKRPIDAGELHSSHRWAAIVTIASEQRPPVPWWKRLTAAELDEVLHTDVDDPRGAPAQLPGDDARTCSEVLGRRVCTSRDLVRAMRTDYRKAEREHRAALKAAKSRAA